MTTLTSNNPSARSAFKVDISRGERIGRVSSEWFSRPDDERFLSLSDLYDTVRFGYYTYGLERAKMIPNVFGGKAILLAFIFSPPKSGLLLGQLSEPSRIGQRGLSHRLADRIDLGLVEFRERKLSAVSRLDGIASLLLRYEILISHLR